jgi:hypothetical protein
MTVQISSIQHSKFILLFLSHLKINNRQSSIVNQSILFHTSPAFTSPPAANSAPGPTKGHAAIQQPSPITIDRSQRKVPRNGFTAMLACHDMIHMNLSLHPIKAKRKLFLPIKNSNCLRPSQAGGGT